MMTKPVFRSRSFLPAVLVLAAALLFGAGAVHAQSQPEYAALYEEAKQTAQEGIRMQQSDDVAGAVENYEAAYRQLAEAAEIAQQEGSVENANMIEALAAKLAYRAGSLLHNNDQSEAAIAHFEFGQQIAPPSYTNNTTGLRAARNALEQGPIVDASRALRDGNPRRTLQLLSEVEEQTGTTYFYQALAHQQLGNSESAIGYAGRALSADGLSGSRRGQMHLVIGEENMKLGDNEAARAALAQAADVGSAQVSDRAEALMERL